MNRIVAWTAGAALICMASRAAAERPFTERKVQVSGHLGFGFIMDDDDTLELNPYGFGLGVRAGYTLDPNIYVGGVFDFFFGDSDDTTVLGVQAEERTGNLWLLQGEVGYDFGLSRSLVVRPKIGLGVTQVNLEACGAPDLFGDSACADDSDAKFSFAIGVEAPIDLGGLFVAPDVRFNLGDDIGGFILALGVGGAF
jgi:opacity protein-like surface antigen